MVRGEIWWARLPRPRGSEPGYRRPVLIIQSDPFNRSRIATVIAAVITSNLRLAEAPGNVLLRRADSNLDRDSVINVSQVVTLDKSYLAGCVGTVNRAVMNRVDHGLRLTVGL